MALKTVEADVTAVGIIRVGNSTNVLVEVVFVEITLVNVELKV